MVHRNYACTNAGATSMEGVVEDERDTCPKSTMFVFVTNACFARKKEDTCMKIDMSNNERMLCFEGLVDAFELGDADLAQVQGARGSNHADSFHRHPWGYSPNYWNNPAYWGYSQPYPWFHRDYDRWDRR